MKKGLSIMLVSLLTILITGCGKEEKVTCTKSSKVGAVELEQKVEYTFKKDYATKKEQQIDANFTSEDSAEIFAQNYKEEDGYKVKLDGTKVNITSKEEIDKDSQKSEANSKETIIKNMEAEEYTCK